MYAKNTLNNSVEIELHDDTIPIEVTNSKAANLYIGIVSSSIDDHYSFDYWKITDESDKKEYVISESPTTIGDATVTLKKAGVDILADGAYQSGYYLNDTIIHIIVPRNKSFSGSVFASFKENQLQPSNSFTPSILSEPGKGTIPDGQPEFLGNNEDDTLSHWSLTTQPEDGYEFSGLIYAVDDDTEIIYPSQDGKTVEWDVGLDGAEYTAHFVPVTARLGSVVASLYGNTNDPLTEGQRVYLNVNYGLVTASQETLYLNVYAGSATTGAPLASCSSTATTAGNHTLNKGLIIESIPQITNITVTSQLGSGEIVSKEYDLTVQAAGEAYLTYMSTPNDPGGLYISTSEILDNGPDIYDACAFVDEYTGIPAVYLAASGGVLRYTPGDSDDFSYMDGIVLPYKVNSNYVCAIGGENKESLTALVRELIDGLDYYCVYTYADKIWTRMDASLIQTNQEESFGLCLGPENVWVGNRHWDGTDWTANTVSFNSFLRPNGKTAYAGSDDGLFVYTDSETASWTKVEGTSGKMVLMGGTETTAGTILTVTSNNNVTMANRSAGYMGQSQYSQAIITVSNGTMTDSTPVNLGSMPLPSGSRFYAGFDNSGELFVLTEGRNYQPAKGSYLYRQNNSVWQYQYVEEFNDATDRANIKNGKVFGAGTGQIKKSRPDSVYYILNPLDSITLYLGRFGSIYASYGETTISFVSNGGSDVAPITKTAGSTVSAPTSPTWEGNTFSGWYTDRELQNPYTFGTMPYCDITLYAKWGDDLDPSRTAAMEALETEYARYDPDDYTAEGKADLISAYETGKSGIENGSSYDAIQTALNTAVETMAAIELSPTIRIVVTVEKFTVNGKFILEPTFLEVDRYELASVAIAKALDELYPDYTPVGEHEKPYFHKGTLTNSFYLAGIYDPTHAADENNGMKQNVKGFLSEFDGGNQSGWMYSVNGHFPGVGASGWSLNNKDVLRWQYSRSGYGADLGQDNSGYGGSSGFQVADKNDLIWRFAEINQDKEAFFAEAEGNRDAYDYAMMIVGAMGATQTQVDDAYVSLGGVISPEKKLARAKTAVLNEFAGITNWKRYYPDAEQALMTQYVKDGTNRVKSAATVAEIEQIKDETLANIYSLRATDAYTAEENALTLSFDTVYSIVKEYLKTLEGWFVSDYSSDPNAYNQVVLALAREGIGVEDSFLAAYTDAAEDHVRNQADAQGRLHSVKSSDNSRMILTLTAIGKDPSNFGGKDLLAPLADLDYVTGQGLAGPVYALLALDSLEYEVPAVAQGGSQTTREALVEAILSEELTNGGWSLAGTEPEAGATALAIQALAPYAEDNAEVSAAIDRAVSVLSEAQLGTGDFLNGDYGNSEATAEVIIALTTLGIDPDSDSRFVKGTGQAARSALNGLYLYTITSGGYSGECWTQRWLNPFLGSQRTFQAAGLACSALTAYNRLQNNQTSLYDMTDLLTETDEDRLERAKAAAAEELENYADAADYREAEQAQLAELVAAGKTAINAAETLEAVNAALADAKAQIDALKTDAEYTAEENASFDEFESVYEETKAYVLENVPKPEFGTSFGEWAVLGLARAGANVPSGYYDGYYERTADYVAKHINDAGQIGPNSTDNARLIIALTSIGRDPRDVDGHDLLTALADLDFVKDQGINGPIWALIAFDTANFEIPTVSGSGTQSTRDNLIRAVLDSQLNDGGWNLSYDGTGNAGLSADADMTAMAVTALAPYYSKNSEVKKALDRAVACLSDMQLANGGFATLGNETAESSAQVIVALSTLGMNAHTDTGFIKGTGEDAASVIDALLHYHLTTGGFLHMFTGTSADTRPDQMATEQALYAMVAYDRYRNSKTSLFDMSDVELRTPEENEDQKAAEEVEKLIDAIGEVTLEKKASIAAARSAYDKLTDAQKKLVSNYDALEAAEAEYAKLEKEADQETLDKAAAKGVDEKISAIGAVTLESENAIKAARAAYDALTDAQKALVEGLAALEAAEAKLAELKKNEEPLVSVTFHLQGGSCEGLRDGEKKNYKKGDEKGELPQPTRENYSFEGWFDRASGGEKYTVITAGLPADLYAQWKSSGSGGGGGSSGGSSEDEGKLKVTFRLIGARIADKDVDLGKEEYLPDYVTWIATTTYNMEEGSTVYDLWVQATRDAGIRSEGADKNYVKTVYAPGDGYALSEFTNGKRSGWMYTINGKHPGFGLKEQELHDGDRVIWHYVNDYSYEVADWFEEDSRWPSLGDGRYYTRWLKAPDRVGGYGGGLGEGAQAGGGGGSSGSISSEIAPSYDGDTVVITADVDHSEGGMAYAADAELDKKTVAEGLEKAEDKSSLKLWVEMEDSNRLVLRVETEAMKENADAGAGLRLGCGKGVIELDADAVALLAESGREVRMVVSYDDWNKKTTVSVRPYPPTEEDPDVRIRIELPVTKEGQALSVVNGDGTTTPIKKSAIIGDRVYAEVPSGTTVTITESRHYWDDVKEKDWFADAVSFVVSHELMNGVDRYEFAPNDPMTRAMLVTVLYRLEDQPEFTGGLASFPDVDVKSWYAEAVAWASESGLVNGTENGFEPGANITREQIATILYRYAKYIGLVGQDTAASADMSVFGDGDKVSSWAQEAMAWAQEVGLFKGDDTGSLNPQGNATRAEVATLLERLIKLIVVS